MARYHGWQVEHIKEEMLKPNFPLWLMRKFDLDQHGGEAYEVIQTVGDNYGIKVPNMIS